MFFTLLWKGFYDRFPNRFRVDAIAQAMLEEGLSLPHSAFLFDIASIYTAGRDFAHQWSIMKFLAKGV